MAHRIVTALWIILLVSVDLSLVAPASAKATRVVVGADRRKNHPAPLRPFGLSSRVEKYVKELFDSADTNHNGSINIAETYELVLKFYIQINRQAPLNPPSKEKVTQIFLLTDSNHNNRISESEFRQLAAIIYRRAFVRLAAHKLITLFGAPLLAEFVVRHVSSSQEMRDWLVSKIEEYAPERAVPMLTTQGFYRTVLVVGLVATLGNFCMNTVNVLLDWRLKCRENSTSKRKRL